MGKIDLGTQNTDQETLHQLTVHTMQQNYFQRRLSMKTHLDTKSSPNPLFTGHTWIF